MLSRFLLSSTKECSKKSNIRIIVGRCCNVYNNSKYLRYEKYSNSGGDNNNTANNSTRKHKSRSIKIDRSGLLGPDRLDHLYEEENDLDYKRNIAESDAMEELTPLAKDLLSMIEVKGPISIHDFMAQTSNHLEHGYYQQYDGDLIGKGGDFVTAPEVSQLFGEMIGVWCLSMWEAMGKPDNVRLVELGPGKGTLMKDILKVASRFPAFCSTLTVHLVELSNSLRIQQSNAVNATKVNNDREGELDKTNDNSISDNDEYIATINSDCSVPLQWQSFLHQIPTTDSATLIIGQEFLDAFPVHQFSFTEKGWREKLVDMQNRTPPTTYATRSAASAASKSTKEKDTTTSDTKTSDSPYHFRVVLSPSATPAIKSILPLTHNNSSADNSNVSQLKVGDGLEISPLAIATCEDIAKVVTGKSIVPTERMFPSEDNNGQSRDNNAQNNKSFKGGAALLIDYGEAFTQEDTLRGFYKHDQVHFLSKPGLVDLTADVDFGQCKKAATKKGAFVHEIETQGNFLMRMGVVHRVEKLIEDPATTDEQANAIVQSLKYLVDPAQMGQKFKVMAITHPELSQSIPGFPENNSNL